MNLQKIGVYIAQKRKELGMTQAELADKLGMSNKSVSKWERGVCLPDVSRYMDLCNILGITINEFIAGEDLQEEIIIEKSEENIIKVTKDGNQKRKRLKSLVTVLGTALLIMSLVMLILHMPKQNYIEPLSQNSTEMMAAELVAGHGDVHLYRFSVDSSYSQVSVGMVTFKQGQKVSSEEFFAYPFDDAKGKGLIAITTSFNRHDAKISVHQGGSAGSVEFPLLKDVPNKDNFARGVSSGTESYKVEKDKEKGILCLVYGKDGEIQSISADALLSGAKVNANDYMYCFTVRFE